MTRPWAHGAVIDRVQLQTLSSLAELQDQAASQAENIVARAQQQAQAAVESAVKDFWDRANLVLIDLNNARQEVQSQGIEFAEQLLRQAFTKLFEQFTPQDRLAAVLRELGNHNTELTGDERLESASDVHALLIELSELQPDLCPWRIIKNNALPLGTLSVVTPSGSLSLAWPDLQRWLLDVASEGGCRTEGN